MAGLFGWKLKLMLQRNAFLAAKLPHAFLAAPPRNARPISDIGGPQVAHSRVGDEDTAGPR